MCVCVCVREIFLVLFFNERNCSKPSFLELVYRAVLGHADRPAAAVTLTYDPKAAVGSMYI